MQRILIMNFFVGAVMVLPPKVALSCALPQLDAPLVSTPPALLWGFRINEFAAYRYADNKWTQVPLQIDEVNDRGDFVLADGLPFTKDTDDGRLDGNDQLVLSGPELGCDFSPSEASTQVGASQKAWKLAISKGAATGYFLIVGGRYLPSPAASGQPQFSRQRLEVESSHYRYSFRRGNPVLLGQAYLRQNGRETLVLSGQAFRFAFRLPWWMVDFDLSDRSFDSSIESWQSGPIRTIVAVGAKFKNFLSLFNFHMFSELIFYADSFQIPTVLEFPTSPRMLLQPGSGLAYSITLPSGYRHLESNLPELPAAPQALRTAPQNSPYIASLGGDWGGIALRVQVNGADETAALFPYLLRRDKMEAPDYQKQWQWLQDTPGDLSLFVDLSHAQRGIYEFNLDLLLGPQYRTGSGHSFASPDYTWLRLPQRSFTGTMP